MSEQQQQVGLGWFMFADDQNNRLATTFEWVQGGLDFTAGNPDNTNINCLVRSFQKRPHFSFTARLQPGVETYVGPENCFNSFVAMGEKPLKRLRWLRTRHTGLKPRC